MSVGNQQQLREFLHALYGKGDIVEVRPIEIWRDAHSGKRRSKVLHNERQWLAPQEIFASRDRLQALNVTSNANIFMGVNPRRRVGGATKEGVSLCRCLWADLDNVTPEIARWLCEIEHVVDPSIIVDSGRGVHMYWLLDEPLAVSSKESRLILECRLKSLYRRLGCDATSDVNRLLRLPGYRNVKDGRNGAEAVCCKLVQCRPRRQYSIEEFPVDEPKEAEPSRSGTARRNQSRTRVAVTDSLNAPVCDRSRRDFAVLCELIRTGSTEQEIWNLVSTQSKFATNGRKYFDLTFANASRAVANEKGST